MGPRKTTLATLALAGAASALAQPAPPAPSAGARDIRYVIIHSPGPRWDPAKGLFEQVGLQAHIQHYRQLLAEGKLLLGGPFLDGQGGGMMLPTAGQSEQDLREYAQRDPAVKDGLLTVQIRPWLIGMRQP